MVKRLLSAGLVICTFGDIVFGQNQVVIDSLHKLLDHQQGGDRFPALYKMAFEYVNTDVEEALRWIRKRKRPH